MLVIRSFPCMASHVNPRLQLGFIIAKNLRLLDLLLVNDQHPLPVWPPISWLSPKPPFQPACYAPILRPCRATTSQPSTPRSTRRCRIAPLPTSRFDLSSPSFAFPVLPIPTGILKPYFFPVCDRLANHGFSTTSSRLLIELGFGPSTWLPYPARSPPGTASRRNLQPRGRDCTFSTSSMICFTIPSTI